MSSHDPYAPPDAAVEVPGAEAALAGRGTRLGAVIIDGIIQTVALVPVMLVLGVWDAAMRGENSLTLSLGVPVISALLFLAIHGVLLVRHGQTVGKRLVGIRIVSVEDGSVPPFARVYALRYLLIQAIASVPLAGSLFALVDALFIFRGDRRCLHDLVAGTRVIRT